jgi:hypothetical protein
VTAAGLGGHGSAEAVIGGRRAACPRGPRLANRSLGPRGPGVKRRTEQVGELLPQLYLHGLAQRDFELALRGLLGDGAPLSASSIARLKERWPEEYLAR